jgi:hypothetical protein
LSSSITFITNSALWETGSAAPMGNLNLLFSARSLQPHT